MIDGCPAYMMCRGCQRCRVADLLRGRLGILFNNLRMAIALAASAQAGRCHCYRTIPWERQGWANPACFGCINRDEWDAQKLATLERGLVIS